MISSRNKSGTRAAWELWDPRYWLKGHFDWTDWTTQIRVHYLHIKWGDINFLGPGPVLQVFFYEYSSSYLQVLLAVLVALKEQLMIMRYGFKNILRAKEIVTVVGAESI